jgi:hypothetical protein
MFPCPRQSNQIFHLGLELNYDNEPILINFRNGTTSETSSMGAREEACDGLTPRPVYLARKCWSNMIVFKKLLDEEGKERKNGEKGFFESCLHLMPCYGALFARKKSP